MTSSHELLTFEIRRGAASIALSLLDDGVDAYRRLLAGTDPEALHDLRVATRRLRGHLRAYRPWLKPTIARPLRRRLKRLTKATNPARDTQVQLAWLQQQRARGNLRKAIDLLIRRHKIRLRKDQKAICADARRSFPHLEAGLRSHLVEIQGRARPMEPALSEVAANIIRQYTALLRKALQAIRSANDAAAIHAARIAGKKLRYLIQPFAKDIAGGRQCIARLKALQDCLGEMHDRTVFADQLKTLPAPVRYASATTQGALTASIAALIQRLNAETEAWYGQSRRRFLGHRIDTLCAGCARFAHHLAATAGRSDRSRLARQAKRAVRP